MSTSISLFYYFLFQRSLYFIKIPNFSLYLSIIQSISLPTDESSGKGNSQSYNHSISEPAGIVYV